MERTPVDKVDTKTKDEVTTEEAPYRWKPGHNPENEAWLLSRLFFFWARPLFRRANYLHKQGRALEHDDLLPLPPQDHGAAVGPDFEDAWKKRFHDYRKKGDTGHDNDKRLKLSELQGAQGRRTDKIRRSLFAVVGKPFVIAGFIKLVNTGLQFTFPILLNNILAFIEETQRGEIPDDAEWHVKYRGYWLSAILFAAMASKAVTENAYFHRVYRAGYQARVAITIAVYNKALRLANSERQDTTLGELINLMQVDATKIETFIPQLHVLWDGILQICGYMTILYTLIGWPCFTGLALIIAAAPVQGVIMNKMFARNHHMAKFTDARVKSTNEALQGMTSVKMYTWEDSFEREISNHRNGELKHLQSIAYLRAASRAYMSALPGLVAVTAFVVYVLAVPGAQISASLLFSALAAFDQLRFPLLFYPMALAQLSQARVSGARIETFLGMKEVGKGEATGHGTYRREESKSVDGAGTIKLKDVTIYWSDPSTPIDKNRDDDDTRSVTSSKSGKSTSAKSDNRSVAETEGNEDDTAAESIMTYPKAVLHDITMEVKPGELCAVVGRVASGKSTLCSAILNEAILAGGEIDLYGKVAYAAQSPWILNATLRDNILFGQPMDQERYDQVIEACQLTYDLELLDYGDMTEIGERGINLSGGQKQRVSMARAAYAQADTIIMDDPLSALDPEVGKALFDECINKLMKGKTRLLVTNQLQFLQYCDNIVALGKGTTLEQGTFAELTSKEGGEVKRVLEDLKEKKEEVKGKNKAENDRKNRSSRGPKENAKADVPEGKQTGKEQGRKEDKLMTKEERNIGAVAWSVYRKYLKAGGGYFKFSVVYFGFALCAANQLATNSWVSFWTSDAEYEKYPRYFYLTIYAMISFLLGINTFARTFLLVRFGVMASEKLHHNLNHSILHAPSSFFDTTPIGRILSRFSKDLYAVDNELSQYLDFFLWCSLQIVFSLGSIVFATPWFGIAIVPLAYMYIKVLNYFREVSRETKRLESVSRSPVYAQFSESLGGLPTIRAYDQPQRFMDEFEGKVDQNIRAWYCNKTADRWLSVRLEIIGATIAGLAAAFATNVAISDSIAGKETDSNFASLAGLSLTYAISVTGLLNWCVRTFAQLEAAMNATERVLYYTEEIPQEASFTSQGLEYHAATLRDPPSSDPSAFAVAANGGKAHPVSSDWPSKGSITLNNLKMQYRPETPMVLKGLSVAIAGGQRIGVVGRTGSGKSSLLLTLLRLVEPYIDCNINSYEPPMEIDGVDTLRIGLKELRSKLGIIPQNPVLFSGTIKSNVDPFNAYSEDAIWAALDRCGMKSAVEEMPGMLNGSVSEYGENLSAGMRQMLVLGRALLRQCRILLLDEATSSVDYETDREIQRTIREAFPGCTVLTIAHRINTIMDSDKILVMRDGLAAEFAPPDELLKDENSVFAEIVRHAQDDN